MLFESESPRTSSVTVAACFARWVAAWPAEFRRSDDGDVLAAHRARLGTGCAVEDAGSDE